MTRDKELTREQRDAYLAALRGGARRNAAADSISIPFDTVRQYLLDHADFHDAVEQAEIDATELVEDALFQAALSGNVAACQAWFARAASRPVHRNLPSVQPTVAAPVGPAAHPIERCGAKTMTGDPCKRWPIRGRTRCRRHGGATPIGPASPHWKDGRYSHFLALPNASERYAEIRDDSGLIELRDEIALLRVRMLEALDSLGDREVDVDFIRATWDEIRATTDGIRRLSDSERKRLKDGQQMMSAERVMQTIGVILEVLKENVTPQVLALVSQEIQRRVSIPSSMTAQRPTVRVVTAS